MGKPGFFEMRDSIEFHNGFITCDTEEYNAITRVVVFLLWNKGNCTAKCKDAGVLKSRYGLGKTGRQPAFRENNN